MEEGSGDTKLALLNLVHYHCGHAKPTLLAKKAGFRQPQGLVKLTTTRCYPFFGDSISNVEKLGDGRWKMED